MSSRIPTTLPRFIWYFSKRYIPHLIGMLVIFLIRAAHLSLVPYVMKIIIDRVAEIEHRPDLVFQAVQGPAVFYVFIGILMAVVYRVYDWIYLNLYPSLRNDITIEMFKYIEGHSYSYFQQVFSGSLANKVNEISRGVTRILSIIIENFFSTAISFIIGAFTLFFVHAYFSILILAWIILFVLIAILLSKRTEMYSRRYSEVRSTVIGKIVDSISNILNIKTFAREKFEESYLMSYLNDWAQKDRDLEWHLLKVKAVYSVVTTFLVGTTTWLLIYERSRNAVSVGDFALIFTIVMFLIDEAFALTSFMVPFAEDVGTCKQSLAIISTPHEIVDKPGAKNLKVERGEIVFDKVHFQYKKGQRVFTNKSVVIHPGQKVGLVGFSGSGKSTFVNLILRFYDIDSGRILIDGQDVKEVTQESLRGQITMIPQDPILFHRTLMENIRYGRLDATDEEVIESSRKAHCHEFVEHMKGGYQALVGERGIKLSGGQRQRIAIARAILKNAPILILDEATSALDSITESYVQDSFSALMRGKTTLVIAHRLSTLFDMDRILVFKQGKIVEDGTHQELMALKGVYASLWDMQAGGFLGDGNPKLL